MCGRPAASWRLIYGLILATSVMAVSREYDSSNAGLVGVTVLVTGVVFWLAHVYARVLAGSITQERLLDRSRGARGASSRLAAGGGHRPAGGVLAQGAVDVVADKTAILAAMIAALVELAAAGWHAARVSGVGPRGRVVSAVIAVTLGSAVVLLKALVH